MTKKNDKVLAKSEEEKLSLKNILIVGGMHLLALPAFYFFSWPAFFAFLVAHFFFGCLGASLGYHKLISHRAFACPLWFKKTLFTIATLCLQGGPIFWAATHRAHHLYTDKYGDPHSAARGFFWSHMGWLFYFSPNGFSYLKARRSLTSDLNEKWINSMERNYLSINIAFFMTGLLFFALLHRWDLFFWLFPMRIVAVWHCGWLINSYTHCAPAFMKKKYGFRIIDSLMCSFLMYGEGYHHTHHNKPTGICNNRDKPYLDIAYVTLVVLSFFKLVKIPESKLEPLWGSKRPA